MDNSESNNGNSSDTSNSNPTFPVVGIGASAGGLEAFEKFFVNMSPDSGMAFVLVQHLDPNHDSMLVDLIRRYTRMSVDQVTDAMTMQPNHVYIIPPNRDLALLHGELHLMEPEAPRGFRLPIDFFFRSLAEDLGDRAICIVLSGTGSDGSLGLKAVKEVGGLTIAQSPESAKYTGMPSSAIATDMVDFILSPDEMPEQLVAYIEHSTRMEKELRSQSTSKDNEALRKIFIVLRSRTGHDFSQYKKNTIIRRVERRMAVNQIESFNNYLRYLRQNPIEIDTLFKDLLIGVTSFFRDKEAFGILEQDIVPEIFNERPPEEDVRVWVCGCSTGEEAYSIAILLYEHALWVGSRNRIQIFATDIDSQSIEKARQGVYPDNIAVDVSQSRLERFFTADNNVYTVNEDIRDMVIFATQNVIKDPPFSKIDLISCRNLLIYLDISLQRKVIPLFHYALNPKGYLFLGSSETLGEHQQLFDTINRKHKLYQKFNDLTNVQPSFNFSSNEMAQDYRPQPLDKRVARVNMREIAERILLSDHVPVAILVNERAEILYTHGRTGKYLEIVTGEVTNNVLNLAREGLKIPLTTAVRKVIASQEPIIHEALNVRTNGTYQTVRLTVRPLSKPASVQGLILILIEDVVLPTVTDTDEQNEIIDKPQNERISELEQELNSTRQYLQTTIEELETSNEELKSTNEELQSSNEELQSTNEELETTKEELQSINEELMTVNAELENKIEQLSRANNDLNNLLASIGVAIIFLDMDLNIQRFNPSAATLINLIESDVGRPITHIVTNFEYESFAENAEYVLDTLEMIEEEVETVNNRWFVMRMRPYRTVNNIIAGVIITFAEITNQKQVQQELSVLNDVIEEAYTVVIVTGPDGHIEYVNSHYEQLLGYQKTEVQGQHFLFNSAIDLLGKEIQDEDEFWKTVSGEDIWRGEIVYLTREGEEVWFLTAVLPVQNRNDEIIRYVLIHDDITPRKQLEHELQTREQLYQNLVHSLPEVAILVFDQDLRYIIAEGRSLEAYGYDHDEMIGRTFYEVLPEDRHEQLEPLYKETLNGKEQKVEYTANDGTQFRLHCIPLDDGNTTNGMIVIYGDPPEDE